ncbi:hypothetical protein [Pseudobacter ginsenosidimutans]|uniref:Uncharacterized protein n=1 Tax=Pseudobacter ginsenosidimutans TaxID=661488 RepID=A0A4Q7N387_9BACT|nr:hypothetical protein [Pseudobacter ginsenosidimutans]QEC43596.1 hypothetical protein FSB84_18605 [Pseudobacter ginsenosidimutans]RZS74995.1 hypothetical protein EV199_0850 [Pseudobacter ginsenosidimutans]
MKRLKKILSTWILVLTAFNVLNQSIDLDYSFRADFAFYYSGELDDIDTIAEFFLEKICGNEQLVPDDNDDSGYPIFAGQEKLEVFPFLLPVNRRYTEYPQVVNYSCALHQSAEAAHLLKGFLNIFSPPPDMVNSLILA